MMTSQIRMIILPFLMSVLAVLSLQAQQDRWKEGIVEEQFLYEKDVYPSCHAGTLAETPEGLVAAWFGGTRERHPDVTIRVSRLVDGKWTPSIEAANGIVNDTLRYPTWNPVLYQIPEGDLLLFYKVGPKPSEWWGMMKRSNDNGTTWSEAERLPEGYVGPVKNKPVLLSDGRLICPSSTEGEGGWRVHFEITSDFGQTWEKTRPINDPSVWSIIQPSVLIWKDGRLQVLCRSRNRVLVSSWSDDNGCTWSVPEASGLPNNNSGTDAVSLADGRQLVVYNHVKPPEGESKGPRTPLNVALSKDGKTWYAALVLEDSEISQYSYPAVIQSADGMVHILYTWRREKMKYVKVDPSKLKLTRIMNEKWPE
jgi:predicted neuraminidase